jgi:hypothetical protein
VPGGTEKKKKKKKELDARKIDQPVADMGGDEIEPVL